VEIFNDEMHRLSEGLKELQIHYNRYFTGALDRPPVELQARLSATIREHTLNMDDMRTSERFRFNTIVSRFHILTEMWNRNVRQVEEGRFSVMDRRDSHPNNKKGKRERELYRARFQSGQSTPENPHMQKLYDSYLSAAKSGGSLDGTLSYRNFYNQVHRRLEKCQEKTGCREVMLRVVLVDNRPLLKVKSSV